jgi:hypothetical protein
MDQHVHCNNWELYKKSRPKRVSLQDAGYLYLLVDELSLNKYTICLYGTVTLLRLVNVFEVADVRSVKRILERLLQKGLLLKIQKYLKYHDDTRIIFINDLYAECFFR